MASGDTGSGDNGGTGGTGGRGGGWFSGTGGDKAADNGERYRRQR